MRAFRWRLLALLTAALFTIATDLAHAEKRSALVIGNGAYRHAPQLENPAHDAGDIAAVLRKMGFEVVEGRDLDRSQLAERIAEFGRILQDSEVALFFYAGHGVQVAGKNYLIPVDATLEQPSDLRLQAIDVDAVIEDMEARRGTNLVFLDACRDNPFSRSLARALGSRSTAVGAGLASTQAGLGTLIAYATQPSAVASDGDGPNSPFTAALLRHLSTPGLEVRAMLTRVRGDVVRETRNRQVPWDHSSLMGDIYLAGPPSRVTDDASSASSVQTEIEIWNNIKASQSLQTYEDYLRQYPGGVFRALAQERLASLRDSASRAADRIADARSQPVPPSPGAVQSALDPAANENLARSIQLELARVGCGPAKISNDWTPAAKSSLAQLNKYSRLALHSDVATRETLEKIRAIDARVCPVICGKGLSNIDGECVRAPAPPRAAARPVVEKKPTAKKITRPQAIASRSVGGGEVSAFPQRQGSGAGAQTMQSSLKIEEFAKLRTGCQNNDALSCRVLCNTFGPSARACVKAERMTGRRR